MHSYNSKFGSPSIFGQSQNHGNNQFSPIGNSVFGGTSSGIFGASSSSTSSNSNFGSPSVFGQSWNSSNNQFSPTWGSTFSGTSTGIFGSSSSTSSNSNFGSPSVFGQSWNSSNDQFSPTWGSTFSGTSTGIFGASSSLTSSSAFGSPMPAFSGSSTVVSGSSLFGQQNSMFGTSSSGFSFTSSPSFGPSTTSSFSSNGFSFNSSPNFGPSTMSPFSGNGFNFNSSPSFGPSTMSPISSSFQPQTYTSNSGSSMFSTPSTGFPFNSSSFGQSTSGFLGTINQPQTSLSGCQVSVPPLVFGEKHGSRTAPYRKTAVKEGEKNEWLMSVSAMPVYGDKKSHEELRWEDKGGSQIGSTSTTTGNPKPFTPFTPPHEPAFTFNKNQNSSPPLFPQSNYSSNPFKIATSSSSSSSTLFGPNNNNSSSSLFNSNLFNSTSAAVVQSSPSTTSSNIFNLTSTPSSIFSGFKSTSPAFQSTPSNIFNSNIFTSTSPAVVSSSPSTSSSTLFNFKSTPSISSGFNSTSGFAPLVQPSPLFTTLPPSTMTTTTPLSPPLQPAQTAQPSALQGLTGFIGQNKAALEFVSPVVPRVVNPFETEPARQTSYVSAGSMSVHYGISSLPVRDKQEAPVRHSSSLLTTRNLSQRRYRLPLHKYNPKSDTQKVPFFIDDCQVTLFPRENPRDFIMPKRNSEESSSQPTHNMHEYENGQNSTEALSVSVSNVAINEDGDGKAKSGENKRSIVDVTELMPKLHKSPEYYTDPKIQDLETMERVEPGSITRVKDFVIGRHGYGSIKFLGPTDIRQLDIKSLVQFNDREVIVYGGDGNPKHGVGEGLNKEAEVTLFNVKCFDKITGEQCVDGVKAVKYREMLMKKAANLGVEFLSYDPVEGVWKFKVQQFV